MDPSAKKPVTITYTVGENKTSVTEHFDFLVVACDPRNLNIADRTPLEKEVNSSLKSFTFYTSLFHAVRSDHLQVDPDTNKTSFTPNFGCRFDLANLDQMSGKIYGFRDEVMTREKNVPEASGTTYVTTYQLDGKPLIGEDKKVVQQRLDSKRDEAIKNAHEGQEYKWIDFNPFVDKHGAPVDAKPVDTQMVDYFAHFDFNELQKSMPWTLRDEQGKNHTAYVSSFTCFESVLHIYLYEKWLMNQSETMKQLFPKDKTARIAIVGAGPSGLLFAAEHLIENNYTNFQIFESSDRYGGKTLTKFVNAPTSGDKIPCELGTCYLSAAYQPMEHLFPKYDAGEVKVFDYPKRFRSIIDEEKARNEFEKENGIDFPDWFLRVADENKIKAFIKIGLAAARYIIIHKVVMGTSINDAMPPQPPSRSAIIEILDHLFHKTSSSSAVKGDGTSVAKKATDELPVCDLHRTAKCDLAHAPAPKETGDERDIIGMLVSKSGGATFKKEELARACSEVLTMPYEKFLKEHGMGALLGLFKYGYQVQGYGPMELIPAYYGLIWMTPVVLEHAVKVELFENDPEKKGFASAVSKGWGTLWKNMVDHHNMHSKITLNAQISEIRRS